MTINNQTKRNMKIWIDKKQETFEAEFDGLIMIWGSFTVDVRQTMDPEFCERGFMMFPGEVEATIEIFDLGSTGPDEDPVTITDQMKNLVIQEIQNEYES